MGEWKNQGNRRFGVEFKIPAELAYSTWDLDLVIERQGDELRIRPAQRRMGDVLGKLAKFSPDVMAQGRGENMERDRETL
jgi:antitoxin VapB